MIDDTRGTDDVDAERESRAIVNLFVDRRNRQQNNIVVYVH
jgi:hypothetical protein